MYNMQRQSRDNFTDDHVFTNHACNAHETEAVPSLDLSNDGGGRRRGIKLFAFATFKYLSQSNHMSHTAPACITWKGGAGRELTCVPQLGFCTCTTRTIALALLGHAEQLVFPRRSIFFSVLLYRFFIVVCVTFEVAGGLRARCKDNHIRSTMRFEIYDTKEDVGAFAAK